MDAPARSRGKSERPRQKEPPAVDHRGTEAQTSTSTTGPASNGSANCSSCAQAGRAAGKEQRAQPVGGQQAVHTAGVSVQEGCECKVLGVCGGS